MSQAIANKPVSTDARQHLMETFGVRYYEPGSNEVVEASEDNLYFYKAFLGSHAIQVERGDALFYLGDDRISAHVTRGPSTVASQHIATLIRGYMPETKSTTMKYRTTLPYVNGCSTKQLFAPERAGDPTLQLLDIPPHSTEQAHHIHSTVRVVYILRGSGRSIVGMNEATVVEPLYAGKICILEPMCPHHFETDDEHLVCMPLHVFSSVGSAEQNHPMFNGTYLMNQGG